jgi:ABC-type sulfate transport system permease subunit
MSALGGIGSATLVRRRRLGPAPLWLLALPIGAVLLLPLAFVGVQASGAGWTKAIHLLRLPHVDELLRNTIELVVLVPPLCAIVGAGVGGFPHVKVFSGKDLSLLASFFAFSEAFTGGVTISRAEAPSGRPERVGAPARRMSMNHA